MIHPTSPQPAPADQQRQQFAAWMAEEMCFSPEEMAFDEARNCFADLRIHIAWRAYSAGRTDEAALQRFAALPKRVRTDIAENADYLA